jgi:hypothetical protein
MDKINYNREFVLKHTDNDYIKINGLILPEDKNIESFHIFEKSNITLIEAEDLYKKLIKLN